MFCSFTLDSATRSMSKDVIHVVRLSTAPWLAPRAALIGCGISLSMVIDGIDFLSSFVHVVHVNLTNAINYV